MDDEIKTEIDLSFWSLLIFVTLIALLFGTALNDHATRIKALETPVQTRGCHETEDTTDTTTND